MIFKRIFSFPSRTSYPSHFSVRALCNQDYQTSSDLLLISDLFGTGAPFFPYDFPPLRIHSTSFFMSLGTFLNVLSHGPFKKSENSLEVSLNSYGLIRTYQWSPTGKARGPLANAMWGDIPRHTPGRAGHTMAHSSSRSNRGVSCSRNEKEI
jgi:hypothetical protein